MKLFDEIKPIYYIDNEMNDMLQDINEKLKNININNKQKRKYMISKSKIRSIHSSLAIEATSLSLFDVENMGGMFSGCTSLTSIDLSNFNTSNVTNMSYMFSFCSSLTTTINIMNANVTDYSYMFNNAATASGSKITVNYKADTSSLVDKMIATKSSTSKVIKGSIIQ